MENEIKVWLTDIKQAIKEINLFYPIRKILMSFKMILKLNEQLKETLKLLVKPSIGS